MRIALMTPIKLLGEALSAEIRAIGGVRVVLHTTTLEGLHAAIGANPTTMAVIDVTQGAELERVRAIAVAYPELILVALGLEEQRQAVIRCGRAGFSAYVPRDANVARLRQTLVDALAGRLSCPGEISAGLMQALFHRQSEGNEPTSMGAARGLTSREVQVLHLIGRGCSNKDIARELKLSVATVKNHVHSVLAKLHQPRRVDAMRMVREAPQEQ